ncbi:hypothetical protein [Blastococcus brunescens]|uniref:Uncharacterized protein n=1 Tax=Blastococcus brunescens TaxID=1564165 RepID=A0ABZ1B350_9ACTN|nr:hypothetical protein [Blastococcus sp. BMG 8361]WRL64581.1 hypothetical protein U6N30_01895 [Blastococcus sp. BMG 8361]
MVGSVLRRGLGAHRGLLDALGGAVGGDAENGAAAENGDGGPAAARPQLPDLSSLDPAAAERALTCGRFRADICAAYQTAAATGTLTPEIAAVLDRSSPAGVLDRIEAPTLLLQGTQDSLFGLGQADANARGSPPTTPRSRSSGSRAGTTRRRRTGSPPTSASRSPAGSTSTCADRAPIRAPGSNTPRRPAWAAPASVGCRAATRWSSPTPIRAWTEPTTPSAGTSRSVARPSPSSPRPGAPLRP